MIRKVRIDASLHYQMSRGYGVQKPHDGVNRSARDGSGRELPSISRRNHILKIIHQKKVKQDNEEIHSDHFNGDLMYDQLNVNNGV